jgi:4-hydroxy-2-oxoglutarate aldolase
MTDQFKGIIAPVTTPFSRQGDLLLDALVRNVEKYMSTPLAGVLVGGSTGEAPHLDFGETVRIVEEVAPVVAPDKKFMAGVACSTLREAQSFIDKISHLRIDALLVSVPSYYKNRMNDRALAHFFQKVAEHSPFPIILYNIPRFSGVPMSIGLVEELSAHENISAMKDSSADLIFMQKVLDVTKGKNFQLITGSAETLSLALLLGINSGILAVACVLPEFVDDLVQAFEQRLPDLASKQIRLCTISWTLVRDLGIQGVKYAMDLRGYEGGHCRLPLAPLTEEEKRCAERVLEGV